jgi:two-component system, OmpR family, sensor histidine kinase KdpD
VLSHEDITPLKQAEATRQQSLDRLRELDIHKRALIAAVSHDVRTPLTVISGTAALLRQRLPSLSPEDLEQLAAGLAHQTNRLERLLSGLLVLSLSEEGGPPAAGVGAIKPQPTHLPSFVDQILSDFDLTGHTVTLDVPTAQVAVDPWILACVLERLIDNAARHTPSGTNINIRLRHTHGSLVIQISDNGPGIRRDDRDRIFLPFEQDLDTRRHNPGAGIGLTVVREAARLHGGDAIAETIDRSGASIVVHLAVTSPDTAAPTSGRPHTSHEPRPAGFTRPSHLRKLC